MKGIVLAEQGHFVNVIPPVNINGGVTGDRFKMNNYGHATIVVQVGVSAAAFTKIIVNECDAATSGNSTAIAYKLAAEETAAGDTLSAFEDVAAAGRTPSANDNIFYVIEIDAAQLSEGYNWIEVQLTNASGNSVIASCLAILTGGRYQNEANATAIA